LVLDTPEHVGQIYLKLKLGARQFMPGIKNLILILILKKKIEFQTKKLTKKNQKIQFFFNFLKIKN
jgi:hypothetical protein